MLRTFRSLAPVLAAASLLAPAVANAKVDYPSISSISSKKVTVGEKLTIHGKHFRKGALKNIVVFKVAGKAPVFVQAEAATSKTIVVTVPDKLQAVLTDVGGCHVPRTVQLGVISTRLSKSYTSRKASPIISPRSDPAPAPAVAPA